jgi:hypothetical protein
MTDTGWTAPWLIGIAAAAIAAVAVWFFYVKGRRVPGDHVFRASRLSSGNHLFPTQVGVTPTSIVHYTPRWLGRSEQSIHMAHVASVRVDSGLLFADVLIESSGGADPVRCHGHHKRDARDMKRLIEEFQSTYYRGQPAPGTAPRTA